MIPGRRRRILFLAGNLLGLFLLLGTWLRGDGGMFLLVAVFLLIAGCEAAFGFLAAGRPSPYLGMMLAPLLLVHYSSVGDFRIRLACFVMLLVVATFACQPPAPRIRLRTAPLTPARAWLISLLAFSLAASALYVQGIHLSGDEPHYVMIAQSLVDDGDFDLKNNMESRSYFRYLPVEVRFHGSVRGGGWYSFHMPGVSFLLAPFYLLFQLLGGAVPGPLFFRLAAAVINSFFALGLFLVLCRLPAKMEVAGGFPARPGSPAKEAGGALFLFFLLTFPFLFHAVHLFPELPAATLAIFAYLFAREKKKYFLSGLFLAGVPWFHLKYALPVLILALFVTAWAYRQGGGPVPRLRRLSLFAAAPALSLALLALYSRALYGSFDPRSISPEGSFLAIPLKFKIETLLSFFLDQRDGLLLFAPLLLLAFLAFAKEIREGIRDFALLAAMAASYILFHAFTTVRGAYSPAARPILFAAWILAVFLAAVHRRAGPRLRALFRLLAGMTAFASAWLLYYPLFLYQPVTREVSQRASSWLAFMSSDKIDLPAFFPSFLKREGNAAWLPNWIWPALLAAALAAYLSRRSWTRLRPAVRAALPLLLLALLFLFCWFPHVRLQTRYRASGLSFYCNSRNFSYRADAGAFRIRAGLDYDLFFDLMGSSASALDLAFIGGERVVLTVRNGRRKLLAARAFSRARLRVAFSDLEEFSSGERRLVHLGLETTPLRKDAAFFLELK